MPLGHSKQLVSNNAMRAKHGRPFGLLHKKMSAALRISPME
jgi:hypothetical protein